MTTLSDLNSCDAATFIDRLRGIYEHSPWIPERAAAARSVRQRHRAEAGLAGRGQQRHAG
jgi:2-oxo-4-hydroxy-4-carboxy--5-ureidoimidazoline (OHCU) decarboxylase